MANARSTAPLGGLLLVGAAGCAVLVAALVLRLQSLLVTPAWRVETAVEAAVAGAGALVATWLTLSALAAVACIAVRLLGASWRGGERLVQRWAPGVVRKALVAVV